MNDRELLEAAAKADGIKLYWHAGKSYMRPDMEPMDSWNPLTDDGDALRLAVKLRLELEWWKNGVSVNHDDMSLHNRRAKCTFQTKQYQSTRCDSFMKSCAQLAAGTQATHAITVMWYVLTTPPEITRRNAMHGAE